MLFNHSKKAQKRLLTFSALFSSLALSSCLIAGCAAPQSANDNDNANTNTSTNKEHPEEVEGGIYNYNIPVNTINVNIAEEELVNPDNQDEEEIIITPEINDITDAPVDDAEIYEGTVSTEPLQ